MSDELNDAVNQLLHQIGIGDFTDSNGHSAKMLKPVHDLTRMLSANVSDMPRPRDREELKPCFWAYRNEDPYGAGEFITTNICPEGKKTWFPLYTPADLASLRQQLADAYRDYADMRRIGAITGDKP